MQPYILWLCFMQFHKQLKSLVNRAATHPKMAALLEVVLEHFKPEGTPESDSRPAEAAAGQVTPAKAAAGDDNGEKAVTDDPGRVIIFTNRRDSVQSIVEMLRAHEPLITARYGPCTFFAACNAALFACFHANRKTNLDTRGCWDYKAGALSYYQQALCH